MNVLGIDLGAGSGRVVLCSFDGKKLDMTETYRFANHPVYKGRNQCWDIVMLLQQIKNGISKSFHDNGDIESLGIDSWGVDFGLLDKNGKLLGNPYYYLDNRTVGIIDELFRVINKKDLMKMTGGYIHPSGTLCQLFSMVKNGSSEFSCSENFLMIPSIFEYYLTGEISNEFTAASTTNIFSLYSNEWMLEVIDKIGLPKRIFKQVIAPGTIKGGLTKQICSELKVKDAKVISVASHDTASAILAIPVDKDEFLFISSGSCSIIGLNIINPAVDINNYEEFALEGGINGQKHLVKNIMGMFFLQQCKVAWDTKEKQISYKYMQCCASEAILFKSYIDLEDDELLSNGNMPRKIYEYCKRTNQNTPNTIGEITVCITQSIAMYYKYFFERLDKISKEKHDTIYITGGGIYNELLCQYTANSVKKRIVAFYAESAVLGNALVQLMTLNEINKENDRKELVKNSFISKEYYPRNIDAWDDAYQNFTKIIGNSRSIKLFERT